MFKKLKSLFLDKNKISEKKFTIWCEEGECPICEMKMESIIENYYCMYEGNSKRFKLCCKNKCYVKIDNCYEGTIVKENEPRWEIFGRDFYVFDDNRREKQIKEIYNEIAYWKNNDRYLMKVMMKGNE